MKGVLLAGGTGSRLYPLTRITNKHLLPIYDRPMIAWSIEALVNAGIDEIMLVTGGTHAGEFLRLARQRAPVRHRPALLRLSGEGRGASPKHSDWPSASSMAIRYSSCWRTTSWSVPSSPWSTPSGPTPPGRGSCSPQ